MERLANQTDGYDIRIDQAIGSKNQLYGRWTWKNLPYQTLSTAKQFLTQFVLRTKLFALSRRCETAAAPDPTLTAECCPRSQALASVKDPFPCFFFRFLAG